MFDVHENLAIPETSLYFNKLIASRNLQERAVILVYNEIARLSSVPKLQPCNPIKFINRLRTQQVDEVASSTFVSQFRC